MASSFYSRYLPPPPAGKASNLGNHDDKRAPPQKRRKLIPSDENTQDLVTTIPTTTDAGKKSEKRKKQKDKQFQNFDSDHELIRGPDLLEDAKHMKLRTRFEKSSKAATKETEKVKHRAEAGEKLSANQLSASEASPNELHGLEPIPQPAIQSVFSWPKVEHLPPWLSNPTYAPAESKVSFSDLPLSKNTINALEKRHYSTATPIQSAVLPLLLPGPENYAGDICIASGTGTGKTIAFIAPMVEALSNRPTTALRGLVVVPTREAVSQTLAIAELCAAKSGLQIRTAKGGKAIIEERKLMIRRFPRWDPDEYIKQKNTPRSLSPGNFDNSESDCSDPQGDFIRSAGDYVADYESKIDILICTPGRLAEHMQRGKGFNLDNIEWLVIDEMDRLMDQHYQDWLDIVINAIEADPALAEHQKRLRENRWSMYQKRVVRKIVVSATMTTDLSKLEALKLHKPKLVIVETSAEDLDSSKTPDHKNTPGKGALYQIPSRLEEMAVPVTDLALKPLQLLQLLQPVFETTAILGTTNISQGKTSTANGPGQESQNRDLENFKSDRRSSTSTRSALDRLSSDESTSDDSTSDGSTSGGSTSDGSPSDDDTSEHVMPKRAFCKGSPSTHSTTSASAFDTNETSGALVFTSTNENALRLTRLLSLLRPEWSSMIGSFNGSATSSSRRKTLSAFRKRRLLVLVASNLASRSLNLTDLTYVVNYDVPSSVEMYIHRVGRTARAGKHGTAITLLAHHEARWFWNEIARSNNIRRDNKVVRSRSDPISESDRLEYEKALSTLGDEARGV